MQESIITGEIADQVALRCEELFRQGLFCAESVLQAVAESQNIENDLIPRIATGFCSGVARTSCLCGAASGAFSLSTCSVAATTPRAVWKTITR